MQDLIALADRIAEQAHANQTYGDQPYISHPRAVAARVRCAGGDDLQIAAALLHDVLEDTSETPASLRAAGIPVAVITLVFGLTRQSPEGNKERYFDFVTRIAGNERLRLIKRADVEENLANLVSLDPGKAGRLRSRYQRALEILGGAS